MKKKKEKKKKLILWYSRRLCYNSKQTLFRSSHLNSKWIQSIEIECFWFVALMLQMMRAAHRMKRENDVCGVCIKPFNKREYKYQDLSRLFNQFYCAVCKAIHIFVQCYSWKVKKLIQTSLFTHVIRLLLRYTHIYWIEMPRWERERKSWFLFQAFYAHGSSDLRDLWSLFTNWSRLLRW